MMQCVSCGAIYEDQSAFYKRPNGSIIGACKKCLSERRKAHYRKNKQAYSDKYKKWALNNPDRVKELHANQRERNKEKISARRSGAAQAPEFKKKRNQYERQRRSDPVVRVIESLRVGIAQTMAGQKAGALRNVSYTKEQLISHIEKQFVQGMSWENYGSDWHVDHIRPIASFNITGPDCDDFKACWCLTNLRPLWATENLSKKDKRTHLI